MRAARLLGTAVLVFALALSARADDTDWAMHGGPLNIRYSPLTQINTGNAGQLTVAWTYDSRDAFEASEMQSHPVVVDGTICVTTPSMKVAALDAAAGVER